MNTAAFRINERTFQVNSENVGAETRIIRRAFVRANIRRDAFQAVAGGFDGRRDRGRDDRGGAEACYGSSNLVEGRGFSFHHIVPARAVNVQGAEAGRA